MDSRFYNSRTWRNKRKEILIRDNNECQICKGDGRVSKASVVHHIKELEQRPDLALVSFNLQSVCRNCHEALHGREKKVITQLNIERW